MLTFSQNKEPHSHVDKDPGESQELHEIIHEQVSFLQACKSCKEKQDRKLLQAELQQRGRRADLVDFNPSLPLGALSSQTDTWPRSAPAWAPRPKEEGVR